MPVRAPQPIRPPTPQIPNRDEPPKTEDDTLSDEEHARIVAGAQTGQLIVGIDRAQARVFFMEVPLARIEAVTGERPYVEKTIVKLLFFGTWLGLIVSLPLAYLAFNWWALAAIPLSVLIYVSSMSRGSVGGCGWGFLTALLAASIVAAYVGVPPNRHAGEYAFAFVFALWSARGVYTTSTTFMRNFVLRNKKAFETLRPRVVSPSDL